MQILALSVVFIVIIAIEVPRLVKEKMWKELGVFSLLLLTGAGLSFAVILDLPVPNPAKIMEIVFAPFTTWLNKILL
ncbi:MAG: hypothetical protein ACOX47_13690 [Bacillota bacterium]|jgi:multisubunit Na+/H+ antiporter MnhB subunit